MKRAACTLTAQPAPPGARRSYPWLSQTSYAEVICRIKNTSSEPVVFETWSCSWYQNWETDNKKATVITWPCHKNVPVKVILAPGQVYEKAIPLTFNMTKPGERLPIRLRFVSKEMKLEADTVVLKP